jgi:hypothetical protein
MRNALAMIAAIPVLLGASGRDLINTRIASAAAAILRCKASTASFFRHVAELTVVRLLIPLGSGEQTTTADIRGAIARWTMTLVVRAQHHDIIKTLSTRKKRKLSRSKHALVENNSQETFSLSKPNNMPGRAHDADRSLVAYSVLFCLINMDRSRSPF